MVLNSNNDVYFAMNNIYGQSRYTLQRYNTNGTLLWSGIQEDQSYSDILVDKNDKIHGRALVWKLKISPVE